jgi:hypothetical protein
MVGLLMLKQLENLSDERVVLQFKHNPYYQYFWNEKDFVDLCLGLILLAFFISKMTKKDRVFYQNLVDLSMIYCGFIVINQFVVWFLRVD